MPEALRYLLVSKGVELHAKRLLIEKLMLQLAAHHRHSFATRSEGFEQLGLAFDDLEIDREASPSASLHTVTQDDEAGHD